jgi:hypothetical protein
VVPPSARARAEGAWHRRNLGHLLVFPLTAWRVIILDATHTDSHKLLQVGLAFHTMRPTPWDSCAMVRPAAIRYNLASSRH